jgi:hypothetical protein
MTVRRERTKRSGFLVLIKPQVIGSFRWVLKYAVVAFDARRSGLGKYLATTRFLSVANVTRPRKTRDGVSEGGLDLTVPVLAYVARAVAMTP